MLQESFEQKLSTLMETMMVNKSKLAGLLTVVDSHTVLLAKGRLRKADSEFQTKHQIILTDQNTSETRFLVNAQDGAPRGC